MPSRIILMGMILVWAVCAQEQNLIDFKIKDQYDCIHTDEELRGNVCLIFGGDRDGSKFTTAWIKAIKSDIRGKVDSTAVNLIELASLKGVPFFVKGKIKKTFIQDRDAWVLMDWKNEFSQAYGFKEDHCNILLFDAEGLVIHRYAGTDVDPKIVGELGGKLTELIDTDQGQKQRHTLE